MRYLFTLFILFLVGCSSCKTTHEYKKVEPTTDSISIAPQLDSLQTSEWSASQAQASMSSDTEAYEDRQVRAITTTTPIKKHHAAKSSKKKASKAKKEDKELGTLAYTIPDTMKLRTTYVLTIRINRDTTDKSIVMKKGVYATIKTTDKMEVLIVDPSPVDAKAFDIVKNNDAIQKVDKDEYSEWVFNVTPLRAGSFTLNIIVKNNSHQAVYFKGVTVKSVTAVVIRTWWDKYWQWSFTTLIIPFVVWFVNRKKKKD